MSMMVQTVTHYAKQVQYCGIIEVLAGCLRLVYAADIRITLYKCH